MKVFVLLHDDRYYDMGDMQIRGIFSTPEKAASVLVARTPSGAKSRAYGAHDENCCSVEEYDLDETTYSESVMEDDPAPTSGGYLITESVAQAVLDVGAYTAVALAIKRSQDR